MMTGVAPDLTCLCKGIANGYPLACVLGNEAVRAGVQTMSMMTGSFWCNADAFAHSPSRSRSLATSPHSTMARGPSLRR